MQVLVVLGRKRRVAIVGCCAAGKHRLAQFASPPNDSGLFVGEAERQRIEDRSIQRDLAHRGRGLADLYGHGAVISLEATRAPRNRSSAPLKAPGRSRLTRCPAPSSST